MAAIAWYNLTPPYDAFVAAVATPLLKIDPRFRAARLTATDRIIKVTARDALPAADIPADQLTYNVILLVALFASNRKPLRDRNVVAFLLSASIIIVLHILAVALSVQSTYAARMGAWSDEHYGTVAKYFWIYTEVFYRLVGMFGAVFACWWASSATMKP